MPRKRIIKYLIVHHNGVPGRSVMDIRRTHVMERGWRDIGYHRVIHEDGSEHPGRPEHQAGAHVKGLNSPTLAVCVIGNGDVRDFNPIQYRTLIDRLSLWCIEYDLDPMTAILGHRETKHLVKPSQATKKTCPGKKVSMDKIRARVQAEMIEIEIEI